MNIREFDVSDRPVNGNILLEGFDGETTGLWKTDGTSTGTQLIRSFEPVVSGEEVNLKFVSVAGNNLFFQIDDSLWRSDGTDEGTQLIVPEIPSIREEFEEPIALGVGNNLFFSASNNLWTSDGTVEGTQIIKESQVFEGFLEDFVEADEKLFFIDRDNVKNRDLWQSDGTAEGTQQIFDGNVTDVVESANGNVYFLNQTDDNLDELWRTDGTEAGTVLIEPSDSFDVIDASNGAFRAFDTLNNRIFFTGSTIIEGQNTNALFAVEDTKLSSQAGAEGIGDETDEFIENAVYRFFNNNSGVHFYTASEVERDAVFELTNFNYEGASYLGVDSLSGQPEPVPVYRFLNQDTGVHLYTISETEKDAVQKLNNFSFEGEALFAYESEVEGSIPIYRFFNSTSGAHFYTPSAGEKDNVEDNLPEFQSEGIAYYALPLSE
jgi:ELWxxDGT repeat protein